MKPPLLLYLAHARDPHRCAVGPALAAAAERAGWAFDLYYDTYRSGRHFAGPLAAADSLGNGTFAAGGRHLELILWLATKYAIAAIGDSTSPLWPVIEASGEIITRSSDPAEIFAAAFARLGLPLPNEVSVLDAGEQTHSRLVTAPFLYPHILLTGGLGVDVTCDSGLRRRLENLGACRFVGLFVDPSRAASFPGGLNGTQGDTVGETYATFSSRLARRHAQWGRGTLLGDPCLIAAQLPLALKHRLLPLYGCPQTDAIELFEDVIETGADPVFGRQYDDHDFFALGQLGRGLQIIDPDPPFATAAAFATPLPSPPKPANSFEPDDATLRTWAAEKRVLVTLVLWSGMIRELHCIPRLLDLVMATGLQCGLVITADSIAQANEFDLSLLTAPRDRGGVLGQVELLLASTGHGVCAEAYMPPGVLAPLLAKSRAELAKSLPDDLMPRGWWPLMDAKLIDSPMPLISWEGGLPLLRIPARRSVGQGSVTAEQTPSSSPRDTRRAIADMLRRYHFDRYFRVARPYDEARPGPLDLDVVEAVKSVGFEYMWTKTGFGHPERAQVIGDFVALPFTAGNWGGWSPFYTIESTAQIKSMERRLLRAKQPAWLASNVDSVLWMLPGEVLEKGDELFRAAQLVANGGSSGRLINVTPNVIARYARILGSRPD